MSHTHAGVHGRHDPFAIWGKAGVIQMMQFDAVRVRLDFAGAQMIKIHPFGIVIGDAELGIFLRQVADDFTIRRPERLASIIGDFSAVPAIDVHDV